MPRYSSALIHALRLSCEGARLFDDLLLRAGHHRSTFSQKGQDRWLIDRVLPSKRAGYFVEVGAGDGRTHSNTYILERDYEWVGILIEANPKYAKLACSNRRCICVEACVDQTAGDADFFAFGYMGGLVADDTDYSFRKRGAILRSNPRKVARLKTQTLEEVLVSVNAPSRIDYLSIDVEGAEYRVLSTFPFENYQFEAITVERPTKAVHRLLKEAGYVLERTYRFDGFYVSKACAARLNLRSGSFDGMHMKPF